MGKRKKAVLFWIRIRLRLLRLRFVRLKRPPDAKTPDEMLEEMQKRSKLTSIAVVVSVGRCPVFPEPLRLLEAHGFLLG